jgi:hypothetical protein
MTSKITFNELRKSKTAYLTVPLKNWRKNLQCPRKPSEITLEAPIM